MRLALMAVFLLSGLLSGGSGPSLPYSFSSATEVSIYYINYDDELKEKLNAFVDAFESDNRYESEKLYSLFDSLIKAYAISDKLVLSDAMYLCGLYRLVTNDLSGAELYFNGSISLRKELGVSDHRFRRIIRSLGYVYHSIGKHHSAIRQLDSLIFMVRKYDGIYATDNIDHYNMLAAAYNEIGDYDKAIESAGKGLSIDEVTGEGDPQDIAMLNMNIGISHSRMNDYAASLIYYKMAYDILSGLPRSEINTYINLLNSLAVNHGKTGNRGEAELWFRQALPEALKSDSDVAFLLLANYASFLAEEGKRDEAGSLISAAIQRASVCFKPDSRRYMEVIEMQVAALSRNHIDNDKALSILESELIPYSVTNCSDSTLFLDVHHTYALALHRSGRNIDALAAIQRALFQSSAPDPPLSEVVPDRSRLEIMADKVKILRSLYHEANDTAFLSRAVTTNRNLISLLENVRIGLNEEESRMLLGDNYRQIYEETLKDIYRLYSLSGNSDHFSLAFEYAERGKAAGLLATLRNIKAAAFNIPDSLLAGEKELDRQLGWVREMITTELSLTEPDQAKLRDLRNREYELVAGKAELTRMFGRNYPEYYAARYNASVAGIDDVRRAMRRKTTYLNYVLTDSLLFVFVINHKHQDVKVVPVTPELRGLISGYRKLLMKPEQNIDPRQQFTEYCHAGHALYNHLAGPVKDMLITRQLIISPDGLLTNIPFETLLTGDQTRDDLLYRELDFMILDHEISYTYSATMYIETSGRDRSFTNSGLFLAPEYLYGIHTDSLLNARQLRQDTLFDLPYARDEAKFAHSLLGGELYLNENALESVYKTRASGFSIIHLAMHTLVNNDKPAFSRLIFSNVADGEEDGLLNTYELYSVPLTARLVIVSSCNTGYGKLRSGEGMMSLARGFVSAGTRSVIMSLWEVDDKWGAETVKDFYRNLKSGMSKSGALRKAKIDIITGSYQFQSHPYYWSTLLLYGNREAMFHDNAMLIAFSLLGAIVLVAGARTAFWFYSK